MFCKVGELVLHICAGAFATEKTCLQLPEHYRLGECEKDLACFQDALPSLVKAYTKLVLSADPSIIGSSEVVKASKVLEKEMKSVSLKRRIDS